MFSAGEPASPPGTPVVRPLKVVPKNFFVVGRNPISLSYRTGSGCGVIGTGLL